MAAECEIREVEVDRAEAVLTLRVFVPGAVEDLDDHYHLARVPPPECVITSVKVNPDGSVTPTGFVTFEQTSLIHHMFADGVTADGRGCGSIKSVSIEGRSADTVAVRVRMSWRNRPAGSGGFDEQELLVPWLGAARLDLPGGGWLAAGVTPVGEAGGESG
ncbi:MAG: hypothetical protein K2X82_11680 [Gemmataceae bacterium]|nr:hypothetical protein [Gemmataceae bacterium]